MRAQAVALEQSSGRILSSPVFRPGGKKLLAKGHVLRDEDVRALRIEGMDSIWVAALDEDEVSEEEAVCGIAAEIACGSYRVDIAPGGRANLTAADSCCVLVDEELLRQVNSTSGMVIATTLNFAFATAGQRIATVKSAPFAVQRGEYQSLLSLLRERGPILQARPINRPTVAVLYSDLIDGERARTQFEPVVRQKLERFGIRTHSSICVIENEEHISRGLQYLLRGKPAALLVASTTAPAGPDDAVGRAMARIGCSIERFLAPVEPGCLMLMSYKDETPILAVPGGFRSPKAHVIDLMLPPMLSRYRVSRTEIGALGHGGLLQ